jgi:hypothetical protein
MRWAIISFSVRILLHRVKVKLSRYTPWWRMGGEEEKLLPIPNLGTRWGWVVSVMPRPRFTPGERTPGTHWIGGWVDLRAGLDAGARKKILCPCRGSNPDRPARSQTLYWLSSSGLRQGMAEHGDELSSTGTWSLLFGSTRFEFWTGYRLSLRKIFVVFLSSSR